MFVYSVVLANKCKPEKYSENKLIYEDFRVTGEQ